MIQINYLAHSSLLVECGGTKIVFDPWLKGPAYYKQWFLWPLPVNDITSLHPDIILMSHGHEDHLHSISLKEFNKDAHVFFPFQWRDGIKPFLKHLGFSSITEAITFKTYTINDIHITYISFSLESVIVIKYKDEVLVNINDALNSNHENAVNFILKEIRKKWAKIDYLFSGWSGAGYFPNQIRYPGKDDIEIGKLREQYFANNFFRFTNYLQPRFAIPFAPGFVLLKQKNQWINHVKFPRTKLDEYYLQHFSDRGKTKFLAPFPGDSINNGILNKKSILHNMDEEEQYALAYRHYENDIIESGMIDYATGDEIKKLVRQLTYWTNYNKILYHPEILSDVIFSVKMEDTKEETYLNITCTDGEFKVAQEEKPLPERRLLITVSAKKLLYAFTKEWGGDIITTGYGFIIEIYGQLTLEKNLDIVCMRLITRYPITKKDLLKYPVRALKFFAYNPKLTTLWMKQKIMLKPYINKYPYNERDHWLTYNKCDLCAVCKMPEINREAYL